MSYTFENLSPLDFEKLGVDLLQKHLKQSLIETFKPGKDWGIDGRYVDNSNQTTIIQFKHYKNFQDLKSNLKKESKKISKKQELQKSIQYILVTSIGLSPYNKQTIREIIPCIKRDQDIYGQDELNNLLRQYPDIVKSHFKLWLNNTTVLERIYNNDICNQTKFEIETIEKKSKLYVENRNIQEVEDVLKENHFCIISGVPGVGKTTLARMLILKYLSSEYELIVISRDIKEAFRTFSREKKILYYCLFKKNL